MAIIYQTKVHYHFCDVILIFVSFSFIFLFVVVFIIGTKKAEEDDNVILKGFIEFCPFVQYFKCQMRHDGKFIDVNIHKSKYKGTNMCLWNPTLVINGVGLEDGGDYRLKVKLTTKNKKSNVHRIEILPRNGKPFYFITIINSVFWSNICFDLLKETVLKNKKKGDIIFI